MAEESKETLTYYRIGTPGKPWGEEEKSKWRAQTMIRRSYRDDVVDPILNDLKQNPLLEVVKYGQLKASSECEYPLYAVKTKDWDTGKKPSVCVTGGVHGYETSGVKGALLFLQEMISLYAQDFNILVFPCVSPWAYERMERWNQDCKDPNRWFLLDGQHGQAQFIPETNAVLDYVTTLNIPQWTCHLDLHETTDSDETEYMPANAAAEKGEPYEPERIPDGFFLYVNSQKVKLDWAKAIIDAVSKEVMHIAQPDEQTGEICGIPVDPTVEGVALLPPHICKGDGMSSTNATYHATTELYPDSPKVTDEDCNKAHVVAITASLDFLLSRDLKDYDDHEHQEKKNE